jgi:NodT family efflux transporter outer membrane factor (OMF) lipoprotein
MEKNQMRHVTALLMIGGMLFFQACAWMQNQPTAGLPDDLPAAWSGEAEVGVLPVTAGLLDLIDEDVLRDLVREALNNNPNLKATALRLKAERTLLSGPRSRLLPKLNAELSRERHNQKMDPATGDRITANSHRLSLGVSWEIDLWGRLADAYAASEYAVSAKQYETLHARDALAARVIQAWIQQAAIRRSLTIEEEHVSVLERIQTVFLERFKVGIGSLDELSEAKSRAGIARADLMERKAAWRRAIRTLEVLLGRYPRGELLSGHRPLTVAPPPVNIPAAVLLKRPDIRAALARVDAARRSAGSAEKAILPDLRLSGQLFKKAALLSDVRDAVSYWNILGSLLQPLFEPGRIMDESRARRTEAVAALMDLKEIVLRALKEVEDGLDSERKLAAQGRVLETVVRESEKSSLYFEERYRQGLESIQNLLIAREQEMAARIRLSDVSAERLRNRVDLALAVGVGVNDEIKQTRSDHES